MLFPLAGLVAERGGDLLPAEAEERLEKDEIRGFLLLSRSREAMGGGA